MRVEITPYMMHRNSLASARDSQVCLAYQKFDNAPQHDGDAFCVSTKVEMLSSPGPNRRSKEMSRVKEANFHAFCCSNSGLITDELSASRSGLVIPVEISLIST